MFVSLVTHGLQAVAISLIAHRTFKKHPAVASAVGALVGTLLVWKCGLRKLFNEKLMK